MASMQTTHLANPWSVRSWIKLEGSEQLESANYDKVISAFLGGI